MFSKLYSLADYRIFLMMLNEKLTNDDRKVFCHDAMYGLHRLVSVCIDQVSLANLFRSHL